VKAMKRERANEQNQQARLPGQMKNLRRLLDTYHPIVFYNS